MNEELERLAADYDSRFGPGKADDIISSIMISHSADEQIEVFKKANGREIILELDDEALDSITIRYK